MSKFLRWTALHSDLYLYENFKNKEHISLFDIDFYAFNTNYVLIRWPAELPLSRKLAKKLINLCYSDYNSLYFGSNFIVIYFNQAQNFYFYIFFENYYLPYLGCAPRDVLNKLSKITALSLLSMYGISQILLYSLIPSGIGGFLLYKFFRINYTNRYTYLVKIFIISSLVLPILLLKYQYFSFWVAMLLIAGTLEYAHVTPTWITKNVVYALVFKINLILITLLYRYIKQRQYSRGDYKTLVRNLVFIYFNKVPIFWYKFSAKSLERSSYNFRKGKKFFPSQIVSYHYAVARSTRIGLTNFIYFFENPDSDITTKFRNFL